MSHEELIEQESLGAPRRLLSERKKARANEILSVPCGMFGYASND